MSTVPTAAIVALASLPFANAPSSAAAEAPHAVVHTWASALTTALRLAPQTPLPSTHQPASLARPIQAWLSAFKGRALSPYPRVSHPPAHVAPRATPTTKHGG